MGLGVGDGLASGRRIRCRAFWVHHATTQFVLNSHGQCSLHSSDRVSQGSSPDRVLRMHPVLETLIAVGIITISVDCARMHLFRRTTVLQCRVRRDAGDVG